MRAFLNGPTNAPDNNPGALKSLFGFLKIALIKFLPGSYKVLKAVMPSPNKQLYEFASILLDAGSRILLKAGTTVRPTPKALETLLLLVCNGVQVEEKDQFQKELRPDSFIEESSFSRDILRNEYSLSCARISTAG